MPRELQQRDVICVQKLHQVHDVRSLPQPKCAHLSGLQSIGAPC